MNIGLCLLIFGIFPGAMSLLKRGIHKKDSKILLFHVVGYVFSRGICLLFLPNVPGAMFI